MIMKLKEFVNITKNKANNQISFNLRAKQLSKIGIKPQYLLNIDFPKPTNSDIIQKEEKKKKKIWKK